MVIYWSPSEVVICAEVVLQSKKLAVRVERERLWQRERAALEKEDREREKPELSSRLQKT